MGNMEIVEIVSPNGETQTHIIIDRGSNEYTSMPKAVWDEQQKAAERGATL